MVSDAAARSTQNAHSSLMHALMVCSLHTSCFMSRACRLPPCPLHRQVAPSIGCMYFLFEVFMAQSVKLPQLNLRLPQQAAPQAAVADAASA